MEPDTNMFIDGRKSKCTEIEIKDLDGNVIEF